MEDACEGDDEKRHDTVVLDLSGCERLFGSPEKIANDLRRVAGDVGFDARVAVAGNVEAAVCAARGFPGITVIAEGDESVRLGTLPISSLSMPVELLETLKRWGIHTCAEFAVLPDVAVVERLGQEGRRWQLLARGSHSKPLLPKEPPVHFDECMELEFPVELLDPLMFVLNRLLTQLCARLGMHVLSAREIALTLTLAETRCAKQRGPSARAKTPASRTLAGQHVFIETSEARLAEPCSPRRRDRGQGCSDASAGTHETDGFVLAA